MLIHITKLAYYVIYALLKHNYMNMCVFAYMCVYVCAIYKILQICLHNSQFILMNSFVLKKLPILEK